MTSTKIVNRDVTREKIGSSGQLQGKVLKSDGSGGVEWGDDQTEPGSRPLVEFAEAGVEVQLTTSWQTILQVDINVPASGKLHVVGNACFYIGDKAGADAHLGISLTDGGAPVNIAAKAQYYGVDTGASLPATTQYVGSVALGSYTLYLVGHRFGTGGTIYIARPQISVTFIPD